MITSIPILLVDFSPTFYCLPKPLDYIIMSIVLLSTLSISAILLTKYYSVYVLL